MRIGIVGAGYVGLVTGACFASLGHRVICVDNDKEKIQRLNKGDVPIFEPGLEDLIRSGRRKKRIVFQTGIPSMLKTSEVVFICVGTPPREGGAVDLSAVENVAREIACHLTRYCLIVEKSTVPVATGERVIQIIETEKPKGVSFDVASNPEFLREGTAIEDFFHPDRIVIGVSSSRAQKILTQLYQPIKAPLVVTDIKSAELIKHASNSFLATKIAYANSLSRLCDLVGADIKQVVEGMGMDKRIGRSFLNPGMVGGFCLPKDLDAFYQISKRSGYDFKLLQVVKEIHQTQKEVVLSKLEEELWNLESKTVAILGLSFKPDTDDLRFAPSLDIIRLLASRGVKIRVYDPVSQEKAKHQLNGHSVVFTKNAYECVQEAHAVILVTEWGEFGNLDFRKIKRLMALPVVVDTRNFWDPGTLKELGFRYRGMGRS